MFSLCIDAIAAAIEYRTRDREFETSTETSLDGWERFETFYKEDWTSWTETTSNPGNSDNRQTQWLRTDYDYNTVYMYHYYRYTCGSGDGYSSYAVAQGTDPVVGVTPHPGVQHYFEERWFDHELPLVNGFRNDPASGIWVRADY
ncbi:MAG: hypothetical protein LBS74_11835 [Oscillospiraceae bacterium]|jgi:hypothetical protein|nr:hypothetical protein [Oscillospiraceae bacterium]